MTRRSCTGKLEGYGQVVSGVYCGVGGMWQVARMMMILCEGLMGDVMEMM